MSQPFRDPSRRYGWVDLLLVAGLAGLVFGLFRLANEAWGAPRPQETVIDLESWWALPRYTFFSLARGLIAYVLSLAFTLTYGYWAAKDPVARRVLIPLLDVLQSIPVLGFMPGLLLVFTAAFPGSNIGLELAAIVSIFTGQAWNMTFSFYQSVRAVPQDLHEAATVYRFGRWDRFRLVELPYATMGLVWNSMMSMAGGWFFLATIEGLEIGGVRYWSPGIGSYIRAASNGDHWDWPALGAGVAAMVLMIVALDQLLWRPVVAWSQKFRFEEGGAQEKTTSWFLDFLRRSHLLAALSGLMETLRPAEKATSTKPAEKLVDPTQPSPGATVVSSALFATLILVLGWGAYELVFLMLRVPTSKWGMLGTSAFLTLGRVLACVVLGTLWALPAGLAIGLSPRLARVLQPVVQVLASFPAPLLFPLVVFLLDRGGVQLNWGSIVLMLLGTQWYILFNVIAGAMAIPADLKEAARSYSITGWERFKALYFPAVFPFLVTGWVTAAGGAWNASIVAEYVEYEKQARTADGLGAVIMQAAAGDTEGPTTADGGDETAEARKPDYPLLAAAVLVMSLVVVTFNRLVWHRCYQLAERRFSLTR